MSILSKHTCSLYEHWQDVKDDKYVEKIYTLNMAEVIKSDL